MRTTLAALAGAGAAFAAYTPDSYSDNAPPAYGGDVSSSAAGTTSSSSYVASTSSSVASPATGTPGLPSCWSTCFQSAGVTSPEDTCDDEELTSCIEKSCSTEEADEYKSWLADECGSTPSTSSVPAGPTGSTSMSHGPSGYPTSSSLSGYPHGTGSSSSVGPSSYPMGTGSMSSYPIGTGSSKSSYPVGTGSITSSYPVGPSGYVPSSSGSPGGYGNCTTTYSSVCTETETLIYRSTTEYVPTTITHIFTTSLPSGSCASVPYPITSSSSVPTSPEQPTSYPAGGNGGYGTPSSPSSPEQPETSPAGGYTTVTDVETIYTTVCPATQTSVSEGQTYTSVYQTTSEVTETYQTTIYVTPTGGAGSPTGGADVPSESSPASPTGGSDLPACFNVCFVKNGATSQEAVCENSAVADCIKEMCDAAAAEQYAGWVASSCGGAGEGSPSEGGNGPLPTEPAGGNGGSPSEYTSVSPVTKPFTYGDWTSYYTDFETVTLTSYVTETEGSPAPTGAYSSPSEGSPNGGHETTQTQVYETEVTTAYTTVCPATDSEGITTSTVQTTSTISLTFTVTTTDYPEQSTSSSVGGPGSLPPYPTGPASTPVYPTGSGSGVVPTGSVTPSSSTPAGPTDTPSIPSCWAQCFAKYEISSESALCGNIDVEMCIKAECPTDSYDTFECWLNDYCGAPSSTSSGVVGPTGTGVGPTGTGVGPTGTGVGPTGTGVGPTGTGVGPTGTSAPSGTISTSSSSTCSLPTPTQSCKRCEGQPGDDKFCGLDINTNIYKEGNAPITCNTVEYDWEITTGLISPDGVERMAILVNGQSPGPMLEANWGDEIIVHVKNSMPKSDLNGTTIHWHGIHQKGTPEYDGTPSLTQCPIAPGETFTYKFRATQYGSSWYHSHFALQAYDGLYGPMTIHGPVQEGYEYDGEEFVTLQDWRHAPLTEIYHNLELVSNGQRSSPTLDNGLINGMNTWENGGKRWSMTVEKGKTYRLRVLNAAIQSTFKFYIDGHSFKVIAADFVPIEPFETNIININNGQRYDVIFTADQPSGNYWMRSDVQAPCSNVTNGLDVKAIVHYADAPVAEPTSEAYGYTPECIDEPAANLVPIVKWNAGASSDEIDKDVLIQPNGGNPNLFKWTLSGTAFFSQWSDPTLQSIYDDGTVPTYSGDLAIREDNLGEWIYVIIDSVIPLPHPIHLHGHDFLVLGQGVGPYNPSTASLNLVNPPRRDTAIMPFQLGPGAVGGYLVVAFYTDNPGVWLMHCHIGWHNAMGFALQIIEGLEDIKETVDFACQMEDNCEAWHAYAEEYNIQVTDSGI